MISEYILIQKNFALPSVESTGGVVGVNFGAVVWIDDQHHVLISLNNVRNDHRFGEDMLAAF
jgi:hypothetical protein